MRTLAPNSRSMTSQRRLPWRGWLIIAALMTMTLLMAFFTITDFTPVDDSVPGQVLPTIVSTPSA